MTDRERWTVYPLIFLTLGIALKDKLVDVVDVQCRNVFCKAVVVTDQKGREQTIVSSDAEGGFVRARGTMDGLTVTLGHAEQWGGLFFSDRQGHTTAIPGSVVQLPKQAPQTPSDEHGGAQKDRGPEVEPPARTPDPSP
jgi:hypothetical protein